MKKSVIFIILIIILSISFIAYKLFLPNITLYKGKNYTVNYKSRYSEPGYKAIFHGKNVTKDVVVRGNVNTKKLGKYKIIYSINNGIIPIKVIRKVYVRDLEKPKIELDDNKDIYVCPGSKYKIGLYKAVDNYDGNITSKVKVTLRDDFINYSVKDSSGNYDSITRRIKYDDIIPPKIKLKGGDNVSVYLNESYEDLGYTAYDNCDEDVTPNVKVSSNIDISKTGKYEVSYKVSDSHKNKVEKKRIVNVVERGANGTIYLTFDDGPRMGITNEILDILKEEGVKATFFVTNGGPDELIKREYDEGHTVALHTATHNYSYVYSSADNYFEDLERVHTRVLNITGYDSRIIRFPGGSSNTISKKYSLGIMSYLTNEVLNRGYRYFDWNINCGDAGETTDKDVVYQNVVSHLSHDKVNVILMHDIKPYTRDALKNIIEYGKNNGYLFDRIEQYSDMVTQKVNN